MSSCHKMKVVLVSLLLFGLAWAKLNCECGVRNTGRIINGKDTKKNEYPWIVALQKKANNLFFCGGTIITQWHVLTAAHCVRKLQAKDLVLVVGGYDLSNSSEETAQRILVDKIIRHPSFDADKKLNDITLFVTSTKIEFNEFVGPVCMPTKLLGDQLIGQMGKAMGWGLTNPNLNTPDRLKKLREVDLEIVSHRYCKKDNARLCTHTEGKDTCQGDSGGPLAWLDPEVNRFTLVGVVSYGIGTCGNSTWPGIYTDVSAYRQWISDNIWRTKSQEKTCHKTS